MTTFIDPAAIDRSRGWTVGASTGVFFANATPGAGQTPFAPLRSLRGFFGDAMNFSGATDGNNAVTVPQLTDPTIFDGGHDLEYFAINGALVSATDFGIAGAFAATNKNAAINDQVIAVAAHAANHDTLGKGWGFYVDSVRMPGCGTTWGGEIQIANKGPSPTADDGAPGTTPFGRFLDGGTRGLTIGSGADPAVHAETYPADVALYIAPNPSGFLNGITFGPGALEEWADEKKRAINMTADGTRVSWWSRGAVLNDGNPYEQFWIEANYSGALASTRQGIRANNSGLSFINDAGHPFFFINNGPDTQEVNYIAIASAAAGVPPRIYTDGVDDDSDLYLDPLGTGVVRFGKHTASADAAVSGYITMKDETGTSRKLAVIA